MLKYLILTLTIFAVLSCSKDDEFEERFLNTYREIVYARELYMEDSTKANEEVEKVFEKYSYTEPEFRNDYFELAQDREKFITMIDSVREITKKEVNKLKLKRARDKDKYNEKSVEDVTE